MSKFLQRFLMLGAVVLVFGTASFANSLITPGAGAAKAPADKTLVPPPIEKAPRDKPSEPMKVSNEPLVFENAIQTMVTAFHMKKVAIGLLGDEYSHILKMVSCVSLSQASIVEVYHTKINGKITRLVLLNGEKSGLHLLFGENCSDTISLDAVETSILALVTAKANRYGNKGPPEMVLPVTLKGRSPTKDGTLVSYQTIDGFFTIYQDDPKVLTSLLETKTGETIFSAHYALVHHVCTDASAEKECL